jgi:hypothetical protein
MEFQGRIAKVLPVRSGVSQRTGNEWKSLPFIFEYFENPTDRFADSVMLETFDTKVIENLKEGMEVRCGFGHKTREYTKDGKTMIINDIRLYKIESVHKEQPAGHAEGQQQGATPAPQQQGGGDDDDLPF